MILAPRWTREPPNPEGHLACWTCSSDRDSCAVNTPQRLDGVHARVRVKLSPSPWPGMVKGLGTRQCDVREWYLPLRVPFESLRVLSYLF